MKAKEINIKITLQKDLLARGADFRLFDQNIPENALGNYAAYKQLRVLYLDVWVCVTQPKGPEKPH